MSAPEKLRKLYAALADRELNYADNADRSLYAELWPPGEGPLDRLEQLIELGPTTGLKLVAGYRGTGKTSAFSALQSRLLERGRLVLHVDLRRFPILGAPIEPEDFLLLLLGAADDAARRWLPPKTAIESAFSRLRGLLPNAVEVGAGASLYGLSVALRRDPGLTERSAAAIRPRMAELGEHVKEAWAAVEREVRAALGTTGTVLIFDSLEHIRGGAMGEQAEVIRRSVIEFFSDFRAWLEWPETQVLFSVPAYLLFMPDDGVSGAVVSFPSAHVRTRAGEPDPEALRRMRSLVERRGDWRQVVDSEAELDELILASGGHPRQLLQLLTEALLLKAASPATGSVASRAVARVAGGLVTFQDERALLAKIAEAKDLGALDSDAVDRVMGFLDSQLVFCYLNGRHWYDVNPLLADQLPRR